MENSAFTELYWKLMPISSRHPNRLRGWALVVAGVQLTSVTWVPVVHPTIHPDLALKTPVSAVDHTTDGSEQLVMGEVMCVACTVSANALPSPYRLLPAAASTGNQEHSRQSARWHPLQTFSPTNPARAPPTL